jgi:thiol-disulfide isomerase/thioredoxin
MKKSIIVGLAVFIFATVVGVGSWLAFSGDRDKESENTVTEDMIQFKEEYEALNGLETAAGRVNQTISIPEFNLIRYTTPEEILEIAENGTGLIFFGFPQCPWCRQMAPLLIDVALDMGLDTIHYIDLLAIRTTWQLQDGVPVMTNPGHPRYQDLLTAFRSVLEPMELNPFHITDADGNRFDTGELRIFVPTVVAIRDGVIVDSHVYTVPASIPGNPYGNQWNPLTNEETRYLRAIYERVISALLGNDACTEIAC